MESVISVKTSHIKIFTLGIGGREGAPIPLPDGGFKKDREGNIVLTKLDEESLQKIARETGGGYVHSTVSDNDLRQIYFQDMRKSLKRQELKSSRQKKWEERFVWFALFAFGWLLLEIFLSETKPMMKQQTETKESD
jgi:Ca-activated chloride channel family protein